MAVMLYYFFVINKVLKNAINIIYLKPNSEIYILNIHKFNFSSWQLWFIITLYSYYLIS